VWIKTFNEDRVTEEKKARRGDWEASVDKQIREAMERGDFDNLRGAGKPLDLSENPYTPEDWRLAYKVLKDAGVAPEWIEQGKEIRDELRALTTLLDSQSRWQCERRAKIMTFAPDKMFAEYEHLAQSIEKTCGVYRKRAAMLNKAIDTFNLKVPNVMLQVPRIKIEEEIERFRNAGR
jgi:DnaJ family protein C protein 28